VLDVATGTGAVGLELLESGCTIVGVDQSPEMLAVARERLPDVEFVEGRAEALPFEDASFDALTVTYLLRYVDDPGATIAELTRVVRPGGTLASLEFGIPPFPPARWAWEAYTGAVLPLAGRLIAPGWADVGSFLRGSIKDFYARLPLEGQLELWRAVGVEPQYRRMSFGGGVVVWGRKT
jgi:demethylmenaquinone methyltransferase/2-methoxy-6-polyprenyl-1,4-benzoquinol methylase